MTNDEVNEMCDKLTKAFGRRLPDAKIDEMVDRFLSWRLPKDFGPDCGIEFTPPAKGAPEHFWPIGTNLLTAEQAKGMIEYVIFGKSNEQHTMRPRQERCDHEWIYTIPSPEDGWGQTRVCVRPGCNARQRPRIVWEDCDD